MKKLLFFILLMVCLLSCTTNLSISEVQNGTIEAAKELLEEDNNTDRYFRMDRYFIDENPDKFIYTGTLKSTLFYKSYYTGLDSLKVYFDVIVKFQDTKYNAFTISLEPRK